MLKLSEREGAEWKGLEGKKSWTCGRADETKSPTEDTVLHQRDSTLKQSSEDVIKER